MWTGPQMQMPLCLPAQLAGGLGLPGTWGTSMNCVKSPLCSHPPFKGMDHCLALLAYLSLECEGLVIGGS